MVVTREREAVLSRLYWVAVKYPGWVGRLRRYFGLSDEELVFLEKLDDTLMDGRIAHDKWLASQSNELEWGIFFADGNEERLALLSERLAEAYQDYENSALADRPAVERLLMLQIQNVEGMEKARRSLLAEKYHSLRPEKTGVTDADIVKAREYPLEKLVEVDRAGRILCPWHNDSKPSMWVKNGFGYCFSCGQSCDSIRWLMEIKKMKFHEAVKWLCGN